ncbi:MAG: hypothetical protein AAFN79_13400 [Pseudomonadota bacterium]
MSEIEMNRRSLFLGALGCALAPAIARADDDDDHRRYRKSKWERRELRKRRRRKLRRLRRERDFEARKALEDYEYGYRRALRKYEARGTRRAYRRFQDRVWELEAKLDRRLQRLDRRFERAAAEIRFYD